MKLKDSLPLKIALMGVVALSLLVPLAMIQGQIHDRETAAAKSRFEVSNSWGLAQTLAGPVLRFTYNVEELDDKKNRTTVEKVGTVYPRTLDYDIDISTQTLHRSIYDVMVYGADVVVT
ncbi:MAG: inner membrane CreD family protein, partial [Oscillospiraceae bacterium]|nr:inner membrane CreD family protein [Oscillospiraceae bacterium]